MKTNVVLTHFVVNTQDYSGKIESDIPTIVSVTLLRTVLAG